MLPEAITPEIVVEHHGEPMTTSLAIAAGTENEHDSVILLIRKNADHIREFGELVFQIAEPGFSRFQIGNLVVEVENKRSARGRPTEYAWLNEQQATFLLTLMRNSPIVIEFKKALVRAFFALREQVRAAHAAPGPFLTGNPAHAADQLVSADRIFRGMLRAGRSAGLPLASALRRANQIARERTGLDVLAELDMTEPGEALAAGGGIDPHGAHAFCDEWLGGDLAVPAIPCRSEDLYAAYLHWCLIHHREHGTLARVVAAMRRRPDLRHRRARYLDLRGSVLMSGFVLPEAEYMPPAGVPQTEWLTARARQFAEALDAWRNSPE